jgi:hypothetical protein
MIISQSRRFIFIHIHKAGGTSVEFGLAPHLAWNDIILGSTPLGEAINDYYRKQYQLDKRSSVSDVERVCGLPAIEDYYMFSVVRHPLERLCSLYNFVGSIIAKWAATQGISPDEAQDYLKNNPDLLKKTPALTWPASRAFAGTSSFSEFIHDDLLAQDKGFHTQVSRLKNSSGDALRGAIFRLEDRAKWLGELRTTLGFEFDLPHKNSSELKLATRDTVSEEDKKYIEKYYADDYAAFGY